MAWGDDAWGDAEWGGTSSTTRIAGTYGLSRAYNGDQYAGQPLTSQAQLPIAPINFVAVLGVASYVSLSWVGSANTVTFELQRSTDSGSTWTSLSSTLASPFYTDTNTLFGTTYTYRVRGINSVGSGPWSSTVSVSPVGDDGDYFYLYANASPVLVESDSDYLYLYANAAIVLVEADGDYLYLYANNAPSAPPAGFIMGAPAGTLYMLGTAPPAGFTLDAPAGQPLLFIPALPAGFTIDAPAGDLLQVVTAAPAGFVLDAPAGIGQLPPSLPLTAYENVGFQTPLPATMFLMTYENVGFGPVRKKPTIFVGALYVAPRTLGLNTHAMVLFAYENVGFFIEIDPESVLYAYEDVTTP